MKLVLGVNDVAYSGKDGASTTGEVAEILEDRYHVMEVFYEEHKQDIADALAASLAKSLESLFTSGREVGRPTYQAEQNIEAQFRAYLDANEWSTVAPAAHHIAAAKAGKSKRKKDLQYDGPRPAFIDTGLYQSSFRAEVKPDDA